MGAETNRTPRDDLVPRGFILLRGVIVAARIARCAAQVSCRLLLNRLRKARESRASIVGRTIAEMLEALGPTYTKVGQILSMRPDWLPRESISHFSRLRDHLSPVPFHVVRDAIRQELGREIEDLFPEFEARPIASASIASVYRARLHNGRQVVVKIRRPSALRQLMADMKMLTLGARLLSKLPVFRHVPVRSAIHQLSQILLRQLDFERELAANKRIRRAMMWEPDILVPEPVDELCSASVLTMEYIDGFQGDPQSDVATRQATVTALRGLFRLIFVEGFVHCDMHQGNMRFLPGNKIALIDFGFMAELSRQDRLNFAEFFYAMATNDGERCADIAIDMAGAVSPHAPLREFRIEVIDLVASVSGRSAGDFQVGNFVFRLFELQRRYKIHSTTAFTMPIIALLFFEGRAKDSYPDLDFQQLARPFILRASLVEPEDR